MGRDLLPPLVGALVAAALLAAVEMGGLFLDLDASWQLGLTLLSVLLVAILGFAVAGALTRRRGPPDMAAFGAAESRALLQAILDLAPIEIYVKDLEGRYCLVNRRAAQRFEGEHADLIGKTVQDLMPREHAALLEVHDRQVVRKGAPSEHEHEVQLADRQHTFLITKFPIRDATGRVAMVGTLVSDITAPKELEREREQEQTERSAERASEAKSLVLSTLSHDLRQPLQSLGLLASGLGESELDRTQRAMVEAMTKAIYAMGTKLSVLLDNAELVDKPIACRPRTFELGPLLDRTVGDFTQIARQRQIELRQVPCSATVYSDPGPVERIIANLLANALQFTDGGRVLVGCRQCADSIRIEVWDTGIGIEPQHFRQIFEKFYRVAEAGKGRKKGPGLGLALVDRLSRLLGLRVSVHSQPGKGSVFAVEVPRSASAASLVAERAEGEPPVSVLLIEDDDAVLDATSFLIRAWGYEVMTARDPEEALAHCREPLDIVVADYRLPDGHDGVETIARIREALKRDIPGVIVTGDSGVIATLAKSAPNCDFLHKPVVPEELHQLLEAHLERERQRKEATAASL